MGMHAKLAIRTASIDDRQTTIAGISVAPSKGARATAM
jgi:hypothetical protein